MSIYVLLPHCDITCLRVISDQILLREIFVVILHAHNYITVWIFFAPVQTLSVRIVSAMT